MAVNNKDFLVKNGLQVGGNTQITGSLTAAGLVYPVSDGDFKNAIVTDGSGSLSFESVDTVESDVTNNTGSLIPKGTPVYQTGAAGNTLTIAPAEADDAATMPAIGVAASDISDGDTGRVIHFGPIFGIDTSAFSEGDRLYVAASGGYQEGRPTGETNVVQFLGVVTKVHATNGGGVVFGGGRSMDVPNLDDGNIFIGDNTNVATTSTLDTSIVPEATNQYFTNARAISAVEGAAHLTIDGGTLYVDTSNNYIGINDTSPNHALDVTGSIGIAGTEVIDSGGEVVTARLKDSGVTSGTYGSASAVPVLTIDAKGRVTSASSTAVAGVSSTAYNTSTGVLTINTSNGGSFTEDLGVGTADSPTFAGLLVGTTDADPNNNNTNTSADDGFAVTSKILRVAKYNDNAAVFNRTGSDGAIVQFRKSGSTVGNIGAFSDDLYIHTGDTGLRFNDGNDQIWPVSSGGSSRDNAISLGGGTIRFKDLYLSGKITNDGTGGINIDGDGRVGIGTGSSISADFHIYQGVDNRVMIESNGPTLTFKEINSTNQNWNIYHNAGDLNFQTLTDAFGSVSTKVLFKNNGNVGIGTADPNGKLTVALENSNTPAFRLSSPTSDTDFAISSYNDANGTYVSMGVNHLFDVSGNDAVMDTNDKSAAITLDGRNNGRIQFLTNSSGIATPRMSILQDGNVGIGTTSPTSDLHVVSSSGDADFQLQSSTQTLRIDQNSIRTTTNSSIGIFTNGNTNQLYLNQSTGNVGINTSSPNAQLDINGKLEADELSIQNASATGFLADFYNGTAGVDNRVAIRTVANNSGDPYLFFDAGGTNMVVGNFWQGTNNNELRMGPGSKVSDGTFDGIRIRGNGATLIGNGFTQVSQAFTDAQLTLGGVHNAKFNTSGHIKLLITGVDNDSPATAVRYCRMEDENGAINWDFVGPTASDGRNAYLGMNANQYMFWDATTVGSITRDANGTTYNTTSDRRLKDNITTITDGKEKLLAMNPVTHTWKADPNTGETVHGFIAQEIQQVVPEAVSGDPDGDEMMSMDYGRITPVIVAALQDALKEIEELKTRINELEAK